MNHDVEPESEIAQEAAFARALLDRDAAVPATLAARGGQAPSRRFAVYRNNVYKSLIDVLASRYPVALRLVGEDFFRATARLFIEQSPPSSPVLLAYGAAFADFIECFPPAASVPYLADVLRLEWAWHAAYHAADAEPMDLTKLAARCADAAGAVFALHPSAHVVRSDYPVVTIWERVRQEAETAPSELPGRGEDALILRPALAVEVRKLPPGGAVFVEALRDGCTLSSAAARSFTSGAAFDLQANLAGLMTAGAIVGAEAGAASR